MGIEVSIDLKPFEKALKEYPENANNELRLASKRMASKVEETAKKEHRFTTRTGRLVKSIKAVGSGSVEKENPKTLLGKFFGLFKSRVGVNAYVTAILADEGSTQGTEYGKYVHEGQRSWSADRFIDNAIEKNHQAILSAWEKAIDKANRKF